MSFKSRDLMTNVLPAEGFFACTDITKAPAEPCVDPTKAPADPCVDPTQAPPPEIAERELSFAMLRDQLREALSQPEAGR